MWSTQRFGRPFREFSHSPGDCRETCCPAPTRYQPSSVTTGAPAIILKCDQESNHTPQRHTSKGLSYLLCSMVWPRCSVSLVACRVDARSRPVGQPTDNRGADPASLAGLDPQHAVSRTLQICTPQSDLADLQHAVIAAEDARFYL